jgi:hypothetical protein
VKTPGAKDAASRAAEKTAAAPAPESGAPEDAKPAAAGPATGRAADSTKRANAGDKRANAGDKRADAGDKRARAREKRARASRERASARQERERASARRDQAGQSLGRAGWVFGAITVIPAMLVAAWLLPSFPLLLTGRLSARPMVFMFIPLAGGLCYFAVRRLPAYWPAFRPAKASPPPEAGTPEAGIPEAGTPEAGTTDARTSKAAPTTTTDPTPATDPKASAKPKTDPQPPKDPGTPWWAVAATIAIAIAFTAWQIAERTQQVIYLRDPATYLQVAYWIAHHGYLPIPSNVAAFGGPHPGLSFASSNFYPRGAGIVPQFMTGMPLVLAAAIWLNGIPAALILTPVIGGCAVLSFGGLAARLAGPRWAPAAATVLAVSLPEQYTSRGTFSEPLAQVLLFGGLCLLADSLAITRNEHSDQHSLNQDMVLAALGGLALGLTILVRVDGLSDILPAVPFLGVLLAARCRQAIPFAAGLILGVGCGLADGYLKSRPYLDLEAPSLRPLGYIVAATLAGTVILVAATASPAVRRKLSKARTTKAARWLPATAAVLTTLIFVGFAVRPLVQTVAGETIPTSIAYVAELQKLAGLPIDGHQQYYEESLYWVIWYLGVPTVLLGALGLAALAKRGTSALISWDDPTGAARAWALPLMIALWVIVTVLYRPAVSPDQPWASRRLVPFVLPGLILGAIWAVTWLKNQAAQLGRTKTTAATVAVCGAASLLIPTALTTLDLSFTNGVHAHGMAFRKIGPGELDAVNGLCGAIGPEASVVILDQLTADRFAQVVRGVCGMPAAVMTSGGKTALNAVIKGIDRTGRRPVLLAQNQDELPSAASDQRELAEQSRSSEVVDLLTTQEAHNLTAPPTRTWLIHYTVWMSVPVESGS